MAVTPLTAKAQIDAARAGAAPRAPRVVYTARVANRRQAERIGRQMAAVRTFQHETRH